jgi:hypothetical protein
MYRDFDRRLKKEIKKHVDARINSRSLILEPIDSRSLMFTYFFNQILLHALEGQGRVRDSARRGCAEKPAEASLI